ncbi:NAD(P)-dependent oxidoreductase [Nesterenkonia sp. F]|uniref:NAD(P)-dependent oxidoreductase n=1 Tax=Nesterenkonia sp. F TaxID=795955 RepID=UPI000255CCF3|nr:NAD(P)H-binding protein [Nesterenkonia sp. F]
MARITVLGGTGYAGGRIAREAVSRGHQVTTVSRGTPSEPIEGAADRTGDVTDETLLAELLDDADVVVNALAARGSMVGRVVEVSRTLVRLAAEKGVRLGVVGGAGVLKVSEDGPRLIDTDGFPEQARPEASEMIEVLGLLEDSDEALDWFYVSPAAGFGDFNPGERTGSYRIGGEVLLTDEEGGSDISGDDYALAFVDEIETPRHRRARFGVAN